MRIHRRIAKTVGGLGGFLAVWLSLAGPIPWARAADPLFDRQVRPILNSSCVRCHSGRKNRGGLDLSTREKLLLGGDSGPSVVPGKPADSILIDVLSPRGKPHMPPKKQLPPAAIATLTRWVGTLKASDVSAGANQNAAPNKGRAKKKRGRRERGRERDDD